MTIRTTDTLDEGRIIFREPEAAAETERTAQVTDPVCGMDVDPADAATEKLDRNGTTYYFCSSQCKQRFEKNPEELITAV